MKKDTEGMSEEELREELKRIRSERAGKGRERKRVAKTKRMDGVIKEKRKKKDREAEVNADWV